MHIHTFVGRIYRSVMLKKDQERDKLTETNDQTASGRVRQSKTSMFNEDFRHFIFVVCQNFLVHSDSGLAHRLQEEECRIMNSLDYR